MPTLPDVAVSRIGGDVAVDFFNTVDWRREPTRRSDRLASYQHLLAWMRSCELLDPADAGRLAALAETMPEQAATEHAAAVRVRDQTYAALVDGQIEPAALAERLPAARRRARFTRRDDGIWLWSHPHLTLTTPVDRLALELERLLTSRQMRLFARCEDDQCGWVFIDTSRQHNRRWCSASDCGNRNRVRAHYRRHKGDAQDSGQ